LLVTLGSPLAMSTVVWHRLAPRPPKTPACVSRWLNFWDRDDIVVARPRLDRRVLPNEHGVAPVTARFHSAGIGTHTARSTSRSLPSPPTSWMRWDESSQPGDGHAERLCWSLSALDAAAAGLRERLADQEIGACTPLTCNLPRRRKSSRQ
jgi:hypothetical protein